MNIIYVDRELQDIIGPYLERRIEEIKIIREYVNEKNYTALRKVLHKLCGHAGGYGLDEYGEMAAVLHKNIHEEKFNDLDEVVGKMEKYINSLDVRFAGEAA